MVILVQKLAGHYESLIVKKHHSKYWPGCDSSHQAEAGCCACTGFESGPIVRRETRRKRVFIASHARRAFFILNSR